MQQNENGRGKNLRLLLNSLRQLKLKLILAWISFKCTFEPSSQSPPPAPSSTAPLQVITEHQPELPVLYRNSQSAFHTGQGIYVNTPLSIDPSIPFPFWFTYFFLCLNFYSCHANTVHWYYFFQIPYICVNMWYLFFSVFLHSV